MKKKILSSLSKSEIKNYLYDLQNYVKEELDSGKSMDLFLDETDIFDDFEKLLPDEEYPIFVITILNGFKSDDLLDKLVNEIYGNKYKK